MTMSRDAAVTTLAQAFASQCIEWILNQGYRPSDLVDYYDDEMNKVVTDYVKEHYGWPSPDDVVEAIRHFGEKS